MKNFTTNIRTTQENDGPIEEVNLGTETKFYIGKNDEQLHDLGWISVTDIVDAYNNDDCIVFVLRGKEAPEAEEQYRTFAYYDGTIEDISAKLGMPKTRPHGSYEPKIAPLRATMDLLTLEENV